MMALFISNQSTCAENLPKQQHGYNKNTPNLTATNAPEPPTAISNKINASISQRNKLNSSMNLSTKAKKILWSISPGTLLA